MFIIIAVLNEQFSDFWHFTHHSYADDFLCLEIPRPAFLIDGFAGDDPVGEAYGDEYQGEEEVYGYVSWGHHSIVEFLLFGFVIEV